MTTTPPSQTTGDPWSIAIKPVGGDERNFIVTVSPDDAVASLHDQIEGETGLKASQQRLIYRGRLIGKNGQVGDESGAGVDEIVKEAKIKDIVGLCDGQTIHLVKKKEAETEGGTADPTSTDNANSAEVTSSSGAATSQGNSASVDGPTGALSGGNGSASLLAALLGLGSLDDNDNSNNDRDTATAARQRWGWRSSRLGRRRPHYRLTADDLEVPDPGSMEPVRQGLMTLHTMLPHAHVGNEENYVESSPLEASRRWYRGQWIDCLDTVNQWLEATVVEVLEPDDILPVRECSMDGSQERITRRRRTRVANDPAVGANDMEGRRRLLLEPCDDDDSDAEEGVLSGFRRRSNNEGVQLLLIHYNGWPHRWDEWIRSDSERIRPFRTRTRHPTMSSTASPTPQSVFNETPRTSIREGSEADDRAALLPELSRVISQVNDLLSNAIQDAQTTQPNPVGNPTQLPWLQSNDADTPDPLSQPRVENGNIEESEDYEELISTADERTSGRNVGNGELNRREYERRQLEMLAPVLDRLGRALTDAAPHIASYAATLPEAEPVQTEDDPTELPRVAAGDHHPPLGGLLSLLTRERNRRSHQQTTDTGPTSPFETETARVTTVDPDHVDFASGLVNTTRGEVRSGPRTRSQQDDMAGLLGAYLAAASLGSLSGLDGSDNLDENGNNVQGLGRLLRDRGAGGTGIGGGGIDIHIHAVVTAPGVTPGGLGFATLGGGGGGMTGPGATGVGARNLFSSARERNRASTSLLRARSPVLSTIATQEEDDGIFSDLYSETPNAVDPNGSPQPGERTERENQVTEEESAQDDSDFLGRMGTQRLGQGISMRSNSLTSTPTRLGRRSTGALSRESSERQRGWGRLFRRRRSRSSHSSGGQDSS